MVEDRVAFNFFLIVIRIKISEITKILDFMKIMKKIDKKIDRIKIDQNS